MERPWVIVAYGDLRGYGSWTSRASNSHEIKEPFIRHFYDTMQCFVMKHRGCTFKYQGDGFMVVKEFDQEGWRKTQVVTEFLMALRCVTRKARQQILKAPHPKLDGFRIRIFSGYVYKLMVLDPNDTSRKRLIPEYTEYAINTAQRLLKVNPDVVCLCGNEVIDALGKKGRSAFRVRKLGSASYHPDGVNAEDIKTLSVLRF